MADTTETFQKVIKEHLDEKAKTDEVFAEKLKKISIEECANYIVGMVSKMKVKGLADEEVFNMAIHYVDEEGKVKIHKLPKGMEIVVNQTVELTDAEKAELKEEAKAKVLQEAMDKMRTPNKKAKKKEVKEQKTLF